jgi:predicted amidophosphoribosyltransferase
LPKFNYCRLHDIGLVKFTSYCAKCGEELPEGARFCPRCGSEAPGKERVSKGVEDFVKGVGPEIPSELSSADY